MTSTRWPLSVTVEGANVKFKRKGRRAHIHRRRLIANGATFTTVVRYDGVPDTIGDSQIGVSGFLPTEDGFIIAGEPHGAATCSRPVTTVAKATYTFHVTVPSDLQVIANGALQGATGSGATKTWTWDATIPMTTYLATVDVGHFDMTQYSQGGIAYANAIDSSLFAPFAAASDLSRFAYSQVEGDPRTSACGARVHVPAGGGSLTLRRDSQHRERSGTSSSSKTDHVGMDDWTTRCPTPTATPARTPLRAPVLHIHRAASVPGRTTRADIGPRVRPTGTTGDWWAATGNWPAAVATVVEFDLSA